jgi:dolichol kinase
MQWDDIEDVSFVIQYIVMPFVVLILIHFICQIAALPYLQFSDWLPKYFKEYISKNEIEREEQRPFILRAMPYIQNGLFLLFFITLFFMRN